MKVHIQSVMKNAIRWAVLIIFAAWFL